MSEMNAPGYELLADVLQRAYDQAANGKGKERHAGEGVPFERQPMSTINIEQGSIDGFLYQARKKALESKRLPAGRAQAELLGAINYLAGAVIALDTWASGTLPIGPLQPSEVHPWPESERPKPYCQCKGVCKGKADSLQCRKLPAYSLIHEHEGLCGQSHGG